MVDRRRSFAIVGMSVISAVTGVWQGSRWLVDQISRVQTGAQTLAEIQKPHGMERFVSWLTATPPWAPAVVLVACLVLLCVIVFLPSRLWQKVRGGEPKHTLHEEPFAAIGATSAVTEQDNELKLNVARANERIYRMSLELDATRVERDALKRELQDVSAQRDAAQSEWRATLRNIDETMTPKAAANGLAMERDALRQQLDSITPLVSLRRRAEHLSGRLKTFRDKMEEVELTLDRDWEVSEIQRISNENSATFARDFRPDLVRLVTDSKQHYGVVVSGLTDDALTREVYGQLGVDPFLNGLQELREAFDKMIVRAALQLDIS